MPTPPKPKFDVLCLGVEIQSWDGHYSFAQHSLTKKELFDYGEDHIHESGLHISMKGVFNYVDDGEQKIKVGAKVNILLSTLPSWYLKEKREEFLKSRDERVAYIGAICQNFDDYTVVLNVPENDEQKIIPFITSGKIKELDITYAKGHADGYIIKNFQFKTFTDNS